LFVLFANGWICNKGLYVPSDAGSILHNNDRVTSELTEKVQARSASTAHKSPALPPVYNLEPSKENDTLLHDADVNLLLLLLVLVLFVLSPLSSFDDGLFVAVDGICCVCNDNDDNNESISSPSSLSSSSSILVFCSFRISCT
jgi:hypothetical protein